MGKGRQCFIFERRRVFAHNRVQGTKKTEAPHKNACKLKRKKKLWLEKGATESKEAQRGVYNYTHKAELMIRSTTIGKKLHEIV